MVASPGSWAVLALKGTDGSVCRDGYNMQQMKCVPFGHVLWTNSLLCKKRTVERPL